MGLYIVVNVILAFVVGGFVYAVSKDEKGYNFVSHMKYSIISWVFLFTMAKCSKCEESSDYDDYEEEQIPHMFRP